MIKDRLLRKKTYIFMSIVLAVFSFIFIRNYAYFKDSYSINSIVDDLPNFIKLLILIKNYDLDSFNGYFRYCIKPIAVIIFIYSFIKGIYATRNSFKYELCFIRMSRTKGYLFSLLEFIIKLLIILLPSLFLSMLAALSYIKSGYLTILSCALIIFFIAIFCYTLGAASNGKFAILLWSLYTIFSIILAYLSCSFSWLGFLSIIEIFNYKYFGFALIGYMALSILLAFIGIKQYQKSDLA